MASAFEQQKNGFAGSQGPTGEHARENITILITLFYYFLFSTFN